MARGIVRVAASGGRATARWCSYRRFTVAVCLGREVVQYTEEQIRSVQESIRIRREAELVKIIQAVKRLRKVFAREEKRWKELPLELKQKVSYEILRRLHALGDSSSVAQQRGGAGGSASTTNPTSSRG